MPALTRHRDPLVDQETWRIYYSDVHAGTIAECRNFYVAMALRLLSGEPTRRVHERRCDELRESQSRIRGRVARVPIEADRGRLSGLARSASLDD